MESQQTRHGNKKKDEKEEEDMENDQNTSVVKEQDGKAARNEYEQDKNKAKLVAQSKERIEDAELINRAIEKKDANDTKLDNSVEKYIGKSKDVDVPKIAATSIFNRSQTAMMDQINDWRKIAQFATLAADQGLISPQSQMSMITSVISSMFVTDLLPAQVQQKIDLLRMMPMVAPQPIKFLTAPSIRLIESIGSFLTMVSNLAENVYEEVEEANVVSYLGLVPHMRKMYPIETQVAYAALVLPGTGQKNDRIITSFYHGSQFEMNTSIPAVGALTLLLNGEIVNFQPLERLIFGMIGQFMTKVNNTQGIIVKGKDPGKRAFMAPFEEYQQLGDPAYGRFSDAFKFQPIFAVHTWMGSYLTDSMKVFFRRQPGLGTSETITPHLTRRNEFRLGNVHLVSEEDAFCDPLSSYLNRFYFKDVYDRQMNVQQYRLLMPTMYNRNENPNWINTDKVWMVGCHPIGMNLLKLLSVIHSEFGDAIYQKTYGQLALCDLLVHRETYELAPMIRRVMSTKYASGKIMSMDATTPFLNRLMSPPDITLLAETIACEVHYLLKPRKLPRLTHKWVENFEDVMQFMENNLAIILFRCISPQGIAETFTDGVHLFGISEDNTWPGDYSGVCRGFIPEQGTELAQPDEFPLVLLRPGIVPRQNDLLTAYVDLFRQFPVEDVLPHYQPDTIDNILNVKLNPWSQNNLVFTPRIYQDPDRRTSNFTNFYRQYLIRFRGFLNKLHVARWTLKANRQVFLDLVDTLLLNAENAQDGIATVLGLMRRAASYFPIRHQSDHSFQSNPEAWLWNTYYVRYRGYPEKLTTNTTVTSWMDFQLPDGGIPPIQFYPIQNKDPTILNFPIFGLLYSCTAKQDYRLFSNPEGMISEWIAMSWDALNILQVLEVLSRVYTYNTCQLIKYNAFLCKLYPTRSTVYAVLSNILSSISGLEFPNKATVLSYKAHNIITDYRIDLSTVEYGLVARGQTPETVGVVWRHPNLMDHRTRLLAEIIVQVPQVYFELAHFTSAILFKKILSEEGINVDENVQYRMLKTIEYSPTRNVQVDIKYEYYQNLMYEISVDVITLGRHPDTGHWYPQTINGELNVHAYATEQRSWSQVNEQINLAVTLETLISIVPIYRESIFDLLKGSSHIVVFGIFQFSYIDIKAMRMHHEDDTKKFFTDPTVFVDWKFPRLLVDNKAAVIRTDLRYIPMDHGGDEFDGFIYEAPFITDLRQQNVRAPNYDYFRTQAISDASVDMIWNLEPQLIKNWLLMNKDMLLRFYSKTIYALTNDPSDPTSINGIFFNALQEVGTTLSTVNRTIM